MPSPLEVISGYPPHGGTLSGVLESRVATLGDEVFLEFETRSWTWIEFRDEVERTARALVHADVRPGDRVAVMAPNHDRFVLLFFALARIGAILVTVNPEFGPDEAGYVLEHAGVSLVAGTTDTLAVVREACAQRGLGPAHVALEGEAPGAPSLERLAATAPETQLPPLPPPDATCLIMYTSGTTGFPKGVMHAQRSFVLAGEGFVERMHLTPEDRVLCILPLFHINALFYSLGGAVAAGAALVLAPRFSASGFWHLVEDRRATEVNIIAAIGNILARRPASEFVPGHHLSKVYGAPVSPEIAEVFHHRFGVETVIEGYGMTEIPGACNLPFTGPHRYGSMGRAAVHPDPRVAFAELRVVDEHGDDVADGEPGELLVRTPIVMQGYYRDPEQTAAAFVDRWFRTGDRVYRDADGFLWFVAREKDIIRRRGENIAGAEIDRVVGAHPGVTEAAAIPVPSELGEDEILVAVVASEGATIDARDIAQWCAERLAASKVPRYVAFVDALPHTPTHRVAKYKLTSDPGLLARAVDLAHPEPTPGDP